MATRENLELWFDLEQLVVEYWADVNLHDGRGAHDFYVEEGLFQVGETRHAGRDVIRGFYAGRAARGARVTRHLVSNARVEAQGEGQAIIRGCVTLFGADGVPVLESKAPTMVADFEAACVLDDDRKWRFKTHVLTPLFRGEGRLQMR